MVLDKLHYCLLVGGHSRLAHRPSKHGTCLLGGGSASPSLSGLRRGEPLSAWSSRSRDPSDAPPILASRLDRTSTCSTRELAQLSQAAAHSCLHDYHQACASSICESSLIMESLYTVRALGDTPLTADFMLMLRSSL